MPIASTITIGCGIVNYVSGTVVWALNWVPSVAGIAPSITPTSAFLANATFTNPNTGGGAQGVATITATLDGVPVPSSLTATVTTAKLAYSHS